MNSPEEIPIINFIITQIHYAVKLKNWFPPQEMLFIMQSNYISLGCLG